MFISHVKVSYHNRYDMVGELMSQYCEQRRHERRTTQRLDDTAAETHHDKDHPVWTHVQGPETG